VALREFEVFASTRVRAGGANVDRRTGNFAAALFTHDTSRALDPHLHTHCIVFNATFDAAENRWKALQNYELCGRGNSPRTPITMNSPVNCVRVRLFDSQPDQR
jgi:conjugative relaxase-like TrwC/TraI family protein